MVDGRKNYTSTSPKSYWKKIGHQKLGSGQETDNLTISWSGTYPSIKVIGTFLADGGSIVANMTFNNNTDSNSYSKSYQDQFNGADDDTQDLESLTGIFEASSYETYFVAHIGNMASAEKTAWIESVKKTATGTGSAVEHRELIGKWSGTANLTRIDIDNQSGASGQFGEGSEWVVLGAMTSDAVADNNPKLPNGAIFEESDTGKHYMFDGTSAWNEMV